ncbi:unnamed protein product [Linum tenue]|uniref:Calcineurin B-like protein n=1 Tax=Linum tenue TaxID=586396 RepID=A0AAV0I3H5_9ROSI|nr:unnamed protein product [Linum tenue]
MSFFFGNQVFDLFDEKRNGVIDFEEFIHAISVFHPGASVEEKINFAFRLYDLRQTGFIEREEVSFSHTRSKFTLFNSFLKDQCCRLTDDTFEDADADMDGKINKTEWKEFVLKNPALLKNMTLPYLRYPALLFCSAPHVTISVKSLTYLLYYCLQRDHNCVPKFYLQHAS